MNVYERAAHAVDGMLLLTVGEGGGATRLSWLL